MVQIKEHLMRIEKEFNSAYEHLILRNRDSLYDSAGMFAPEKIRLTEAFHDIAAESVAAGNSSASYH